MLDWIGDIVYRLWLRGYSRHGRTEVHIASPTLPSDWSPHDARAIAVAIHQYQRSQLDRHTRVR